MALELAKKTGKTVFLVGLIILSVLSILGLVYLTKMAFSDKKQEDGKYFGDVSETERNIARMTTVSLWVLLVVSTVGQWVSGIWTE